MITILKETPITIDGADYLEQLVEDAGCRVGEACSLCFYHEYEPDVNLLADCATVHGCTLSYKHYFKVKKL